MVVFTVDNHRIDNEKIAIPKSETKNIHSAETAKLIGRRFSGVGAFGSRAQRGPRARTLHTPTLKRDTDPRPSSWSGLKSRSWVMGHGSWSGQELPVRGASSANVIYDTALRKNRRRIFYLYKSNFL